MKPTRHILDKAFSYTPACATDLHKTFDRVRRELAAAAPKPKAPAIPIKRQAAK